MERTIKNIIGWLLLTLFISIVLCNDGLLAKFHQIGFKTKDFRMDLLWCNEKYYNFFKVKTFKYNRTTPAINASFNYKIDVKDKIEIVVQAYKFLSNEYRHFPLRFQMNLKKCFDANAVGLGNAKNCGNITTFSFDKDVTYYTCNFVLDESHFPPLIPNGRYKFELIAVHLNEEIAILEAFVEIYTPIPYPKK